MRPYALSLAVLLGCGPAPERTWQREEGGRDVTVREYATHLTVDATIGGRKLSGTDYGKDGIFDRLADRWVNGRVTFSCGVHDPGLRACSQTERDYAQQSLRRERDWARQEAYDSARRIRQ